MTEKKKQEGSRGEVIITVNLKDGSGCSLQLMGAVWQSDAAL